MWRGGGGGRQLPFLLRPKYLMVQENESVALKVSASLCSGFRFAGSLSVGQICAQLWRCCYLGLSNSLGRLGFGLRFMVRKGITGCSSVAGARRRNPCPLTTNGNALEVDQAGCWGV